MLCGELHGIFCQATPAKGHERKRETYQDWQRKKQEAVVAANAEADADTLEFLGADARDDLKSIVARSTIKLENGFAAFPDGDPLCECIKK